MKIKAGVTAEVPDLAAFLAEQTGDPVPENALYVGVYDSDELIGCLIFYSPLVDRGEKGVKFGAALGKSWGNSLQFLARLRVLIEDIVFEEFGYNFLEADVDEHNTRILRLLESAGFMRMSLCEGRVTCRYRA